MVFLLYDLEICIDIWALELAIYVNKFNFCRVVEQNTLFPYKLWNFGLSKKSKHMSQNFPIELIIHSFKKKKRQYHKYGILVIQAVVIKNLALELNRSV